MKPPAKESGELFHAIVSMGSETDPHHPRELDAGSRIGLDLSRLAQLVAQEIPYGHQGQSVSKLE